MNEHTVPPEVGGAFAERDGVKCAGEHLLIDMWGVEPTLLNNGSFIEQVLLLAAATAKTAVVFSNFHQFEPNGITGGFLGLAESHCTIHTWPEDGFAAVDVFMCGKANPKKTIEVFKSAFKPEGTDIGQILRGRTDRQRMRLRSISAAS